MTNTKKRITTILLSVVMAFTMMPMMGAVSHDNTAKAASVPEKVTGLKVAKKSDRWVTLKWNKTPGAKKYIVKQINIRYSKEKDFILSVKTEDGYTATTYDWDKVANIMTRTFTEKNNKNVVTTKGTKATIKNLKCRWIYNFQVFAVNENGEGEYSKKLEVRTKFNGYSKKEKKVANKLKINGFTSPGGGGLEATWFVKTHNFDKYEIWVKMKKKGAKWMLSAYGNPNKEYMRKDQAKAGGKKYYYSYTRGYDLPETGKHYIKIRLVKDNVKGPFTKTIEKSKGSHKCSISKREFEEIQKIVL